MFVCFFHFLKNSFLFFDLKGEKILKRFVDTLTSSLAGVLLGNGVNAEFECKNINNVKNSQSQTQ